MARNEEKIVVTGEDRASHAFRQAGGSFEGMTATISRAAKGAGLLLAGKQILDLGINSVKAAVSAGEAAAAFSTTFGPALGRAAGFVDDFANKAGFARYELEQMLAITGNVVQGIGATEAESAELSIQMATLAGDVASFSNAAGGAQAVLAALQSAINGEREALKTYGLAIAETEVQERALLETGKERAEQLTRLEKAEATVAIAYEKAGKAVGDLDRTSDSAANTMRRIGARAKEAGVQLGESLLGGIEPVLPVIEELIPTLGNAASAIGKLIAAVGPLVAAVGRLLNPALKAAAFYFDLVAKGATSISSLFGDRVARATLRMGEALEFVNEELAAGVDPAVTLANALRHVAADGELTTEQVAELTAAAGANADEVEAAKDMLFEYARQNRGAGISTQELTSALGLQSDEVSAAYGHWLLLKGMTGQAAQVFKQEVSPGVKELETRLAAAKKVAHEAGLAFRDDLAGRAMEAALSLDEAVDQIDLSLDELETRLAENTEDQLAFFTNLTLLAAMGFGDLAAFLEDQGPEVAGLVADLVGDMERAARLDDMIRNAKSDMEDVTDAYADALEDSKSTMLQTFLQYGIDLADAIEAGFSTLQLGKTLNELLDEAQGAVTPPTSGGGKTPTGIKIPTGAFAEGGIVPGPRGSPFGSTLHGGEEVLSIDDRGRMVDMIRQLLSSSSGGAQIHFSIAVDATAGADGRRIGAAIEDHLLSRADLITAAIRRELAVLT